MTDFLTRLATRQLGALRSVTPRLPPRFLPAPPGAGSPGAPAERPPGGSRLVLAPAPRVNARAERPPQPPIRFDRASDDAGDADAPDAGRQPPPPARPATGAALDPAPTPAVWSEAPRAVPEVATAAPSPPAPALPRQRRQAAEDPEPRASREPLIPESGPADARAAVAVARPALTDEGEPTVKVTIGRIEVRAIVEPPAARTGRAAPRAMSLDEYLERRHGRAR